MVTNQSIQLDIEKRNLEASIITEIQKVFKNMAKDAANMYLATGNVPSQLLASNYAPEFLKEIRDAMRKSIKRFGFNLRKTIEKKHHLFFDAENKIQFIDLEYKGNITITDEDLDPKLESINNQFLLAASLFVANQSEQQNNYITETNSEMLNSSVIAGINDYSNQAASSDNPDSINRNKVIAAGIAAYIINRSQSRSELISSQNVGLAESWARQTEAELIDDADLISSGGDPVNVTKTWFAILDTKTRASHAEADNQEVGVKDSFEVGGEQLKYPRDPNGSAGNIINCRCNSIFDA